MKQLLLQTACAIGGLLWFGEIQAAVAQMRSAFIVNRPFYGRPSYQGARFVEWGGVGTTNRGVIYNGPFPSAFAPVNYNPNIYGRQYETLVGHTQYGYGYDYNQMQGMHVQHMTTTGGAGAPLPADTPVRTTTPVPPNDVLFHVVVPHDAVIWINGAMTNRTGPFREFTSAGLQPGETYTYEIKVRWMQDGKEVAQSKKIRVEGGKEYDLEFPLK